MEESKTGFRWRGEEVFRIEGFSDTVFAFAVTLLVISLEVPLTFHELLLSMRGFVAFAFGFAILVLIWYNQFKFFRRYGLQDAYIIVLNAVLLFLVLFFVYPLKFLFSLLARLVFEGSTDVTLPNGATVRAIVEGQMSTLMIIYSTGYVVIFLVFVLLHLHAYRYRESLDLSPLEVFDTRSTIYENLINMAVGLSSILLVTLGGEKMAGWSGLVYFMLGPAMTINGVARVKKRKAMISSEISAKDRSNPR
jgi:uncharacterized membrane protein